MMGNYSIFYDIVPYRPKPKIVRFTFEDADCKYFGWKRGVILKWLWFWLHLYQRPKFMTEDDKDG